MRALVCTQKKVFENVPGKSNFKEIKLCDKNIQILTFATTNFLCDLRQIISYLEPRFLLKMKG